MINFVPDVPQPSEKANGYIAKSVYVLIARIVKIDKFVGYMCRKQPELITMIAATHEISGQIGFYGNDIADIARFIGFCEKYSEFSDTELTAILDGSLSMEAKLNLSGRIDSAESMMGRLEELKQNWNVAFDNKDYAKLKKQIRI